MSNPTQKWWWKNATLFIKCQKKSNFSVVVFLFLFLNHNIAYFNFCPKSLKRSFTTNFSPISKTKTTSAIPFSQPIEQDKAQIVLLRIVNDIRSTLDNDNISVLLLDLSATIDHQILLSRLNSGFLGVFFAFSLLHSNGFSHTSQTAISIHFSQ